MTTVHGTCLIVDRIGVLLRGPSGSGKSDLALRLIDAGCGRLVADDQVVVRTGDEGCLWGSAPDPLAGRMELRGLGLVDQDFAPSARIGLVVDLVTRGEVERMPEPARTDMMGVELPLLRLCAFDASAVAKLRVAVRLATGTGRTGGDGR